MATWSFIVVSEHTELGVTLVTWPLATSLATPGHCGAGGVTFIPTVSPAPAPGTLLLLLLALLLLRSQHVSWRDSGWDER